MNNTFLIITSVASHEHPVLRQFSVQSAEHDIPFIMIGDTKSPKDFNLPGCDFYSIERQQKLDFELVKSLPVKHYARKNIGYLIAVSKNAGVIIETDDDNYPYPEFWNKREKALQAYQIRRQNWVNVYKYFTEKDIWPRGFSLNDIRNEPPALTVESLVEAPIQQGLADRNPDVDAIYRLVLPLPLTFDKHKPVALGADSICPFNSQNTTWFKEAFPLLYLPSFCSFRMTDIWRSFVAQRICWENEWNVLFHHATVWQERNDHNLTGDFEDEIQGYLYNHVIIENLKRLKLKSGVENIPENLLICYEQFIRMSLIDKMEIKLIEAWLNDLSNIK
ncbi:MAG: STELLO glycosyltransferase family protein [Prevotellaceae bacterium]|jgi:hypothetical protein|nr:STELLO glycosyltransferase family protein [Prevotellaceae bacterium]